MRLFIALELPPEIRGHLLRIQESLRQAVPARWIDPDQLHLTLKFLGQTPDSHLPALTSAIQAIDCNRTIDLAISGITCFPPHGRIRIVAATLADPTAQIARLANEIDQICYQIGFPLEARPFTPHITLGRVKQPTPSPIRRIISAAPLPPAAPAPAQSFSLIESRLNERGPTYVSLCRRFFSSPEN